MMAVMTCAMLGMVQGSLDSSAIAASLGTRQDEDVRPKELRELESVRADLDTLRMLNELKLTAEQTGKLLALIEESRKKIQNAVKEAGDAIDSMTKSLKEQRDAMLKGETVAEEKMREMQEAQGKIGPIFRAMEEANRSAASGAREILDAAQREELQWATRRDPVGQLRSWMRNAMSMFRKMPDEGFEQGASEGILEFMTRFRPLPDEAREEEADRIYKIVAEARELSDEEFARKSGELLKKVVSEGKIGEMAKRRPGPPEMIEGELGRWVLQPRTERMLKARK